MKTLEQRIERLENDIEQFHEYSAPQILIRYASAVLALFLSVIYLVYKTELSSHIQLGNDFQTYFSSPIFEYVLIGSSLGWAALFYFTLNPILNFLYTIIENLIRKYKKVTSK